MAWEAYDRIGKCQNRNTIMNILGFFFEMNIDISTFTLGL